jgi:uncharacterized protein (DUF111 family)
VVELLRGAPIVGRDVSVELTTPTGAALLAGLTTGYGPLPALRLTASGFGAGSRDLDLLPNATQVVIGETDVSDEHAPTPAGQPIVLLEANVDDVTGEVIAHTIERLLEAGAFDAWTTAVTMKKGRPALTVSVLADVALVGELREILAAETGTFGIRATQQQRWPLARAIDEIETDGGWVRVKRSGGRVKAEYEDAARVARQTGRPLRDVIAAVEAAARDRDDDPPGA